MCGRFVIFGPNADSSIELLGHTIPANFNAAPTESLPVIRNDESDSEELIIARWGLLPAWAKDTKVKPFFNARADNLEGNKVFWTSRDRHVCAVMSGFYEWSEHDKTPYYIYSPEDPLLYVAGLWRRWSSGDQAIDTFCIITTKPHCVLADIHHRSPVILNDAEKRNEWLSQPYSNSKQLLGVYDGALTKHPVDKTVNYSRNKGSDLIKPALIN